MPEFALVNGVWRYADEYSPLEWDRLRTTNPEIIMLCCEEKGHQVRRKQKQFFRHNPESSCACATAEESIEHFELKCKIAYLCRKLGWDANVECTRASVFKTEGAEWQADVLAQNGDTYIAFEVQYSPITLGSLYERNERYQHDNVLSVWLLSTYPHIGESKQVYTEIDTEKTPENILKVYSYPTFKTPVFGKTILVTIPEHLYLYCHFNVLGATFDFSSYEASYGNRSVPLAILIESALSGQLEDEFQQGRSEYTSLAEDCKRKDAQYKALREARARIDKEQKAEHTRRERAFHELCRGLFDPNRAFTLISETLGRIEADRRLKEIQRNYSDLRIRTQSTEFPLPRRDRKRIARAKPNFNQHEVEGVSYWLRRIRVKEYVKVSPKFVGWCVIQGCGAEPAYYDKNSHANPLCKNHFEILRNQQQEPKDETSAG